MPANWYRYFDRGQVDNKVRLSIIMTHCHGHNDNDNRKII